MQYTQYFLVLALLPLMAATCKDNSVVTKKVDLVMCDEIMEAVTADWIHDENGAYAPDYVYYCDMVFIEAFEQAFSEDKNCKETLRLDEMKTVFGEPTAITPGIDGVFNILGTLLDELVDKNKSYETVLYECVTEGKIGGYPAGFCPNQTRKLYFLFDTETGTPAITNLHMKGTTGWLKPKGK